MQVRPTRPGAAHARSIHAMVLALGLASVMAFPVAALEPTWWGQPSASLRGSPPPSVDGVGLGWTRLDTRGSRPPAREDHTLTVDPDGAGAWLFGGRTADGRTLGDLWRLDLATDGWERVPRGERAPRGRFGHGAAWMPGVGLVIWAGQSGRHFLDDLWAFRPETASWRRLADADQRRPRARYGSCMALGPDGRLWISHGFTDDLGRFDDTWSFDAAADRWREETPEGRHPGARCLHDCAWTADGRFLLYGGQSTGVAALGDLWILGPDEGWRRVGEGDAPEARSLPAIAVMAEHAWVFGGADADRKALGDLWRLDLASMAWQEVEVDGATPRARSGAALAADPARGRLLLFGGRDDRRAFGDLWMLEGPVLSPQLPGRPGLPGSTDRP